MICNWIGKQVSLEHHNETGWALSLEPPGPLDDTRRKSIADAADMDLIDVKVRVNGKGFTFLKKSADPWEIGRYCSKLDERGFKPLVFNLAALYDVPDPISAVSASCSESGALFSCRDDKNHRVGLANTMLVVLGTIEVVEKNVVTRKDVPAVLAGSLIARTNKKESASRNVKTEGIADIYFIEEKKCFRISQSSFNFKTAIGGSASFVFSNNIKALVQKFAALTERTLVDDSFENSTLPYPAAPDEKSDKSVFDTFYHQTKTEVTAKMSAFNHYSRFIHNIHIKNNALFTQNL